MQGTDIVNDVRTELDALRQEMARSNRRKDKARQRELRSDMNSLRKEVGRWLALSFRVCSSR